MTYVKQTWANDELGGTPISAARLNYMEDGIAASAPATELVNTVAASGATETLPSFTTASIHDITLTANCTLTFPAPTAGQSFTLFLRQDATGNRTVTWPTVKWPGGATPLLSTGAGQIDTFSFLYIDAWYGYPTAINMV